MSSIPTVDCGDALEADSDISDGPDRDSLEHDDTENMAQPSTADDSSRLEALPDELLTMVFEQLREDDKSWRWANARRNFRSLCLVSKKFDLIARPFLFERIEISCPRRLLELYRTVAEDQGLGEQIREIVLSPISYDFYFHRWCDPATAAQKLFDEYRQLLGDRGLRMSKETTDGQDLVNTMCHRLLARTVNLSSLRINVDTVESEDSVDQGDLKRHDLLRDQNILEASDRVNGETRSAVDGGAAVFLPRLKKLTLTTCRRPVKVKALKRLLDLPSLETLLIRGDARNDLFELLAHIHSGSSDSSSGPLARRKITTLGLSGTLLCPCGIENLAPIFPCVEELSIDSGFGPFHRHQAHMSHGSPPDLSTAFGKFLALRILTIHIYPDDTTSDVYDAFTALVGPRMALDLEQLPNLQQIEIPLYMIVHAGPREILPRSLKTLVLHSLDECEWNEYTDCLCWDWERDPYSFLESLRDDLPYFPHLQSVEYCFGSVSCGSLGWKVQDSEAERIATQARLQAISASFAKQNIQFFLRKY